MPMNINDHQPVPVHDAVVMTTGQLQELKDFLTELHDSEAAAPKAVLSDNQFEKLEQLLRPGYELSTLMLADYKRQHGTPQPQVPYVRMADGELAEWNRAHNRPLDDQTERLQRDAANAALTANRMPPPNVWNPGLAPAPVLPVPPVQFENDRTNPAWNPTPAPAPSAPTTANDRVNFREAETTRDRE